MTNSISPEFQAQTIINLAKVSVSCLIHKNYTSSFNELDIEDLTEDTVLKALSYWASFNPDKASLRCWINKIALNVIRDELDYKNKRSAINRDMHPYCGRNDEQIDLSLIIDANELLFYRGNEFDTDSSLLTDEFTERVKERESILSERDKRIWEMVKNEAKPREIAEKMGMSANAVSIRKHYILEALKPGMAELAKEYEIKINNLSC